MSRNKLARTTVVMAAAALATALAVAPAGATKLFPSSLQIEAEGEHGRVKSHSADCRKDRYVTLKEHGAAPPSPVGSPMRKADGNSTLTRRARTWRAQARTWSTRSSGRSSKAPLAPAWDRSRETSGSAQHDQNRGPLRLLWLSAQGFEVL